MTDLTRRKYLHATLATLAGACAKPSITLPAPNSATARTGFQLSELFGNPESQDVRIGKQLGVNNAIAGVQLSRVRREEYIDLARKTKGAWDAVGMKVVGVKGHPVAFERLKLGID